MEGNFFNLIKTLYKKLKTNIILTTTLKKYLPPLPEFQEKVKDSTLIILTQYSAGSSK